MSQSLDRLIYMANQIARNLTHDHDPVASLADHVAKFWDPRMKAMIFAHLDDRHGDGGLDPVAAQALCLLRATGAPASQSKATRFNAVGESGGADAG